MSMTSKVGVFTKIPRGASAMERSTSEWFETLSTITEVSASMVCLVCPFQDTFAQHSDDHSGDTLLGIQSDLQLARELGQGSCLNFMG